MRSCRRLDLNQIQKKNPRRAVKPDGVFFVQKWKTSLVADGQRVRAVRGTLSVAPTALYAAGAKFGAEP